MKNIVFLTTLLGLVFLSSCELLESEENDAGPDIAAGLKEALRVGTDTAVSKLAVVDGYLKDEAVKILLPDQMENQIANFKAIEIDVFGLGTISGEDIYSNGIPFLGVAPIRDVEEDLIMGINRAAESAASEAGPIFFDAITGITIQDANNILFGPEDAATTYLRDNTFQSLFSTYEPKIDQAVNAVTIGNRSVESIYNQYVSEYNGLLNTSIPVSLFDTQSLGQLANLETLDQTDLSAFATEKGLDGLFLKIQEEEGNIRQDPLARVNDLLQDVFGLLD
jgi:hypothetical protein